MSFERPNTPPPSKKLEDVDVVLDHVPASGSLIESDPNSPVAEPLPPMQVGSPSTTTETVTSGHEPATQAPEQPSTETTPRPPEPSPDGVRSPEVNLEAINKQYERKGLFSPAVLERLKSAPEAIKTAAGKAYEGLSSIPLVHQAMGKVEMAYHGYWVDHHESNALRLKRNFDHYDTEIKTLERTEREIKEQMQAISAAGGPGADSLQSFLQKIDKQKIAAQGKRDKAEGKIEDRQAKIEAYVGKRDSIANRFIAELDTKLEPHQERMKELDTDKASCNLEINTAKARHEQELAALKELSERKRTIVAGLKQAGFSERKIAKDPTLKEIDARITQGRSRVAFEKDKLDAQLAKVTYQVAQVKKKASPYEQKRAALMRIKNSRRVEINLPTTETLVAQGTLAAANENIPEGELRVSSSTQGVNFTEIPQAANDDFESTQYERPPTIQEASAFHAEKIPQKDTPVKYLELWNKHLNGFYPKQNNVLRIDPEEFFKQIRLKRTVKIGLSTFRTLLRSYYGAQGINKNIREMALRNFSNVDRQRAINT